MAIAGLAELREARAGFSGPVGRTLHRRVRETFNGKPELESYRIQRVWQLSGIMVSRAGLKPATTAELNLIGGARLKAIAEKLRSSYWFVPSLMASVGHYRDYLTER